jgi:hypothetical protein
VEQLIESLPLQCKHFKSGGCPFETTKGNVTLKKHEAECQYKMIRCPHTAWRREVSLINLEAHVTSQHKAKAIECSPDGVIAVEWPANTDSSLSHWKLSLVLLNGLIFFPMLFKRNNLFYAWLYVTTNAEVKVKTLLEGDNGIHAYTGNTVDISTSSDVAKYPEHILTFTNAQAKQCLVKNDQGRYMLKVTFKLMMAIFGAADPNVDAVITSAVTKVVDKTG